MKEKFQIIIAIIVAALFMVGYISCQFGGCDDCGGEGESKICRVCDREFDYGSKDWKSIINTNMCRQCYKNYKWAIGD